MTIITYYCIFFINIFKGGNVLGNGEKYLKVGELAHVAEVSCRTIDYYTKLGLLNEAARSPGNHRLYSKDSIKTIKVIKELQKQHYSLEEISHMILGQNNTDLLQKALDIQKHLDLLQKEVMQLFPAVNTVEKTEQVKVVSRDLCNKGYQVIQVMLLLLGEPLI